MDTKPCDDQKDKAQQEATNLLSAYPNLKCIMAICSPAVPGAAEAVKQAGKAGAVKVLGLGLPSENRAYVKDGVTQAVILWKVEDLGYLTIQAAAALASGKLPAGATALEAGRLGVVHVEGDQHRPRKTLHFHKGEHRPVRLLNSEILCRRVGEVSLDTGRAGSHLAAAGGRRSLSGLWLG